MVVWCTQDLRRDGSTFMWHQPCQRCKYTTSVVIQNKNKIKKCYKASHSCRTTCERSECMPVESPFPLSFFPNLGGGGGGGGGGRGGGRVDVQARVVYVSE